jgi:predicted TIM-barrel fold metal-dependent hydrolase
MDSPPFTAAPAATNQHAGCRCGFSSCIDVHHHMLPPRYVEYARERLIGNAPAFADVLRWTPARALETMERNGIDATVLSLTQPGLCFEDIEATRAMIRYCNDYGAELVRDHPGKFGFFATLPLTDIDGSLREIEYAFDTLKADGVGLLTSYGNRWPGHGDFDPVFEELNRRKAIAFFHPNTPACCVNLIPDLTSPILEYLFNTARAIAGLIVSGTLSRLPDLTCIFCHAGGALTPQMRRLARAVDGNPKLKQRVPGGAMAEIRKLFYNTAQSADPENLGALLNLVPDTQILFGTDYPYLQPPVTIEPMKDLGFDAERMQAIARDNALRLFPRLRG